MNVFGFKFYIIHRLKKHHQNWSNFDTVDYITGTMLLKHLFELESQAEAESSAVTFLLNIAVLSLDGNFAKIMPFVMSHNSKMQGYQCNGVKQMNKYFHEERTVEKGLGHFFLPPVVFISSRKPISSSTSLS